MHLKDTTAAADGKIWRFTCAGTAFSIDTITDAYGAGVAAIGILRSGTAVTHIDLGGTEVHVAGGFGCNAAAPQAAYASGGALAGTADATWSANEVTMLNAVKTLINNIRTALVNNGIMS
jgi:hypothetical protein